MVVVTSAGNDGNSSTNFPAALGRIVGVGATDFEDNRCEEPPCRFDSNYGPNLSVTAPSEFETTSRTSGGSDFREFGGTSQAAPVVSGVAGLILSESRDRNLGLTNDDIQHLMEQTADNVDRMNGDFDPEYGHGRVNARKALEALQPPNDAVQASHTGGSSQKVQGNYKQFFPDGGYFVDRYEVTGHVDFQAPFQNGPPLVWARERSTKALSKANPNDGIPRVKITNVTKTGFDYKTHTYYLRYNLAGVPIDTWRPAKPSNVKIAYTAIGEPGTPPLSVSLSGPTFLSSGEQGTWYASVSGGIGSPSYV
jgi:subtilisin family serine protease